jgi:hypothetical protein
MTGIDPLQHLTEQLAQAAARLRDGELDPQEAARLVEECARLAGEAASELDRRARAAADAPSAGDPAAAAGGAPPA